MAHDRAGRLVRRRSFRAAGLLMVSVTALLLWSRLKLVTDTPRMVYADPDAKQIDGDRTGEGTRDRDGGSHEVTDAWDSDEGLGSGRDR